MSTLTRLPGVALAIVGLLVGVTAGCDFASSAKARVAAALDDAKPFPPAVKPQWLSKAEGERLNQDGKAAREIDVFSGFGAGDDANERQKAVSAAAMMVKMMLHALYFPVDLSVTEHPYNDPPFHRALSEFEQRAGLKVDGVFTLGEFEELSFYFSLASYAQNRTTPLTFKRISHQPGYMHAEGTWVIQGDQIADPINAAEIACWRSFGSCIVSTSQLTKPSRGGIGGGPYLSLDTSYWDITSWSDTRVVAEQTALCRRNVLTLDETAKQVFQVQTDLNNKDCEKMIGSLATPRMTTLEDGTQVAAAHYETMRTLLERVSQFPFGKFKDGPTPEKAAK